MKLIKSDILGTIRGHLCSGGNLGLLSLGGVGPLRKFDYSRRGSLVCDAHTSIAGAGWRLRMAGSSRVSVGAVGFNEILGWWESCFDSAKWSEQVWSHP